VLVEVSLYTEADIRFFSERGVDAMTTASALERKLGIFTKPKRAALDPERTVISRAMRQ
jgi:hypothetical protein